MSDPMDSAHDITRSQADRDHVRNARRCAIARSVVRRRSFDSADEQMLLDMLGLNEESV